MKAIPHVEAAQSIRHKPVVSKQVFLSLLPELRSLAFLVTIQEDLKTQAEAKKFRDEIAKVRDAIGRLPEGGDYQEIKDEIIGRLSPYFRNAKAAELRAELLLRLHAGQAYAAAQYRVMQRQIGEFPFWKYLTFHDDRVRASHAALDGKIFPANSPFWQKHYPPWEYMCRCQVVPVTAAEADRIAQQEQHLPLAKRQVMAGAALDMAEKQNKLANPVDDGTFVDLTTPSDRSAEGYQFHPDFLVTPLAQLQQRIDPALWPQFLAAAGAVKIGKKTLLDRLANQADRRPAAPHQGVEILSPAKRAAVLKALGMSDQDLANWKAEDAAREQRVRAGFPAPSQPQPQPPAQAPQSAAEMAREQIRAAIWMTEQALGTGVNTTIKLTNGVTVVFKPQEGEAAPQSVGRQSIPNRTQCYREKAASVLDEMLGIGLVPPTELITYNGKLGSAQLWSPAGFEEAATRHRNGTLASATHRISLRTRHDWQLIDDLLRHSDRHLGNFMLDLNGNVALIDNGLSAPVDKQDFGGGKRFGQAGLDGAAIDATNLQRLRDFLAAEQTGRQKLGNLLERAAVDLIYERAREMLRAGSYPNDSAHSSRMPW